MVGEEKIKQTTINESVKGKHTVNKDLCRLIYAKVPFNLMKIPFFNKALESIENYGKSYQSPYNEARITYL